MKSLTLMGVGAAALLAPVAVSAAIFVLDYTTRADSLFPASTVHAVLTTDDGEFYGQPGYLVLGISGTRDGIAIDGLADPFSEIFFPGAPDFVDGFGITFTVGAIDYNLYKNNASFYQEFSFPSGTGGPGEGRLIDNASISLVPSLVPEPASWTLLIAGFAMTGLAVRRRATRPLVA